MPFFDNYPYTNLHNVNLDWVLQKVKEWGAMVEDNNQRFEDLQAAYNAFRDWLTNDYNAFKDYVTSYLENLDVQQEINNKLDDMLASGELTPYLQPYIITSVTDWLDENITPTTPPVDATLSIAGAAADAKATGDAIQNVTIETDDTLSIIGAAADSAKVGEVVSDIDSSIQSVLNMIGSLIGTFGSSNLFPSNVNTNPSYYTRALANGQIFFSTKRFTAGTIFKNIRVIGSDDITGYVIVITADEYKVSDIIPINITNGTISSNILNKTYANDVLIGLYNTTIKYRQTNTATGQEWSEGLLQSVVTDISNIEIGSVLTLTTGWPGQFLVAASQIEFVEVDLNSDLIGNAINNTGLSNMLKWQPIGLQTSDPYLLRYSDAQDIVYTGRWYNQNINGIDCKVTNNGGSAFYCKTNGASTLTINWVAMTSGKAFYAYTIDGGAVVRRNITDNVITLPDTDIHYVRVITDGILERIGKWENGTGYALSGVEVDTGTVSGAYPINPQIMFFGDSIVEGVNALGTQYTEQSEVISATGSFSWYCANKINAVPFYIGYGATGIAATGSFNNAINALNYLYDGVPVPAYRPDAIVVQHGTNDSLSSSDFITQYTDFIKAVAAKYPGTRIYLMTPLDHDYRSEITTVAGNLPWTKLVDTYGWYTGPLHPVAADAEVIGERLAGVIIEDIYGQSLT